MSSTLGGDRAAGAGTYLPSRSQLDRLERYRMALMGEGPQWAAASHVVTSSYDVHGPLDVAALAQAVAIVVARHDAFRTVFDPAAMRSALGVSHDIRLEVADGSQRASVVEAMAVPMDITDGPLARFAVIRHTPEYAEFWLAFEHIIVDTAAIQILVDEISVCYEAAQAGNDGASMLRQPLQNLDAGRVERAYLESAKGAKARDFWLRMLGADPAVMNLDVPGAGPVDPVLREQTVTHSREIPAQTADLVRRRGRAAHLTWVSITAAAITTALGRLCGSALIPLLVPFHNRLRGDMRSAVTFVTRVLPLRIPVRPAAAPREALLRTQRVLLDGLRYGSFPVQELAARPPAITNGERPPRLYLAVDQGGSPPRFAGCSVVEHPEPQAPVVWGISVLLDPLAQRPAVRLCHPVGFLPQARSAELADVTAGLIADFGRILAE